MFSLSADFFQNNFFQETLSGIPSTCDTVWTQMMPDVLLDLIWVQSDCLGMTSARQKSPLAGKG